MKVRLKFRPPFLSAPAGQPPRVSLLPLPSSAPRLHGPPISRPACAPAPILCAIPPLAYFFARGTPISTPPEGATAATVICGGGTEERSSIGASPGHICSSTLAIPLPAAPPCRHAPSGYPSRLVKFACILCYPLLATKELDLVVILQKQGASSDLLHVLGDVDGVVHMCVLRIRRGWLAGEWGASSGDPMTWE
jgi:hypothetical protein